MSAELLVTVIHDEHDDVNHRVSGRFPAHLEPSFIRLAFHASMKAPAAFEGHREGGLRAVLTAPLPSAAQCPRRPRKN